MMSKFKKWCDEPSGHKTIDWMSGYDYELSNGDYLEYKIFLVAVIGAIVGLVIYLILKK